MELVREAGLQKDDLLEEIRRAVEEIYKVKVKAVNTLILPGKLKRVRYKYGHTPDFKKAVVTLAPGQKIGAAP